MNDFVAKFIEGTVVGGVGSLKGVNADWKKIEMKSLDNGLAVEVYLCF